MKDKIRQKIFKGLRKMERNEYNEEKKKHTHNGMNLKREIVGNKHFWKVENNDSTG